MLNALAAGFFAKRSRVKVIEQAATGGSAAPSNLFQCTRTAADRGALLTSAYGSLEGASSLQIECVDEDHPFNFLLLDDDGFKLAGFSAEMSSVGYQTCLVENLATSPATRTVTLVGFSLINAMDVNPCVIETRTSIPLTLAAG